MDTFTSNVAVSKVNLSSKKENRVDASSHTGISVKEPAFTAAFTGKQGKTKMLLSLCC